MTLAELDHCAKTIKFTGGLRQWRPEVTTYIVRTGPFQCERAIVVTVRLCVPERSNPERLIQVEQREEFDAYTLEYERRSPVNVIYRLVRELAMHEVDEGIHLDGAWPFDPHRSAK